MKLMALTCTWLCLIFLDAGSAYSFNPTPSGGGSPTIKALRWLTKPAVKLANETMDYFRAIKNEGLQRALYKKGEQNPELKKLFPKTPDRSVCEHIFHPNTLFELPIRATSRLFGDSRDFMPVQAANYWIDRGLNKKGFEFTKPIKNLFLIATFPFTGFGLFLETANVLKNRAAPYDQLDYRLSFDYRYQDAVFFTDYIEKNLSEHPGDSVEFKNTTGLSDVNHETLLGYGLGVIDVERQQLSDLMQVFSKNGFHYSDHLVLASLRGDSTAINELATRLADKDIQKMKIGEIDSESRAEGIETYRILISKAAENTNSFFLSDFSKLVSETWLSHLPENFVRTTLAPLTDKQKDSVYLLGLELLDAKEQIYRMQTVKYEVKDFFGLNAHPAQSSFLNHLNDPFITDTLPGFVKAGLTHSKLIPYHASQYLEWVALFKAYQIVGLKRLEYIYGTNLDQPTLTTQVLTLQKIEDEILRDGNDPENLPSKYKKFQEWKLKISE